VRIFLASIGLRNAHGGDGLWAKNLRDPLVRMGHSVIVSNHDWDGAMAHLDDPQWVAAHRPFASERLLVEVQAAHRDKPLDLFVSYFYGAHVDPSAIQAIGGLGIPTVNFYCNAVHQFHLVADIAAAYTLCWVPELDALEKYSQVGAQFIHLPMAAETGAYRPITGVQRDIPLLFVGSVYADRARWLADLRRRHVPLHVHARLEPTAPSRVGPGDGNQVKRSYVREIAADLSRHGPVFVARRLARKVATDRCMRLLRSAVLPPPVEHDDMLMLFARSQAILNLSHVYDGGLPGGRIKSHVRLRDFEVPMARGLLFAQHSNELAHYFVPDREVVMWSSAGECAEKLRFYLTHAASADRIRQAGHDRAVADHTWDRRYERLFAELGIQARSSP
jgi:spore maturation protein CgeB